MDLETLKQIDFSRDLGLIEQSSEDLKNSGVNNWIIAECSSPDRTYSKYTVVHNCETPGQVAKGDVAHGVNKDVIINHLGGLASVVFDIFAREFENVHGRNPESLNELIGIMTYFHRVYIANVEPGRKATTITN